MPFNYTHWTWLAYEIHPLGHNSQNHSGSGDGLASETCLLIACGMGNEEEYTE